MMSEFDALRQFSARIGSNPDLVQAAGGNTSIKDGGLMWIKASGTWLADAGSKDIFVPLRLPELQAALAADDPNCENCLPFVAADKNTNKLRPSIETSVHGLMPQRAVAHVHCVSTIAWAIREDGEARLQDLLRGFNWSWIPYARPGLHLARAIRAHMKPGSDVLVLGNHGLAVAADTIADCEALLTRVVAALRLAPSPVGAADLAWLSQQAAGSEYRLPQDAACHAASLDPRAAREGCNFVYYPDHVVFLGTRLPSRLDEKAAAVAFPGKGVLINVTAKPAVEPMVRCLGDVFRRVPDGAPLRALDDAQIDALLNWDAEIYRQTLKPR